MCVCLLCVLVCAHSHVCKFLGLELAISMKRCNDVVIFRLVGLLSTVCSWLFFFFLHFRVCVFVFS